MGIEPGHRSTKKIESNKRERERERDEYTDRKMMVMIWVTA